jgi:hypothetical protein
MRDFKLTEADIQRAPASVQAWLANWRAAKEAEADRRALRPDPLSYKIVAGPNLNPMTLPDGSKVPIVRRPPPEKRGVLPNLKEPS